MTWRAPAINRAYVPDEGDERALLEAFLEFHRETFLWKCSELTPEQLCQRSVATTGMSMLGLIRHLSDVERHWLREVAGGESIASQYWGNPDHDSDFDDIDIENAEADYAAYLAEVEVCRANQGLDFDATIVAPNGRDRFTFRWILIHLIEEYARHNGHADLIREAIDGATGE